MLKIFQKHKFSFLFFLIIVLATILRFSFLSIFPPSMIQDEVGIGYSAISIAQTGKDEWGIRYPMVFKSFGDYKTPAFIYATALLYKIIGWQEVLPRITSAIAGLFVVLLSGLWIKEFFKSKHLGLIAAFIVAISPWTINLSRMALESNLGLAFFMAGLLFMSYAKKTYLNIFLSGLFFSLSTYTFHSFRYTVFLFLSSMLFITYILNMSKLKKYSSFFRTTTLILLLSTILSLPGFLSKGSTKRLNQTLLFTSEKQIKLYEHYENNCHNTFININPKLTFICRLKYNKLSRLVLIGSDSFTKYLSPGFYFFSGDSDPVRNPTGLGEFSVLLFPVWMIGILIMFREYKKYLIILTGYFVAILPAAASGNPHATRLSVLIPFFLISLVVGYKYLKDHFKKWRYFSLIFVLLLLISTSFYSLKYMSYTFAEHEITGTYLSYAKKTARIAYDYVQKGYVVYADNNLYPEPHIYYAYWNKIDPKITQKSFREVVNESDGFSRPNRFGKNMYFTSFNETQAISCNSNGAKPIVIMTRNAEKNTKPTKIIKDNTQLYNFIYIYEKNNLCSK